MAQATDCVVNLVPVLYKAGQPLEEVIPHLTQEMQTARDRLDAAAAKLDIKTRGDIELNKSVMNFIEGVRIMDTGTLAYSYVGLPPLIRFKFTDISRIEAPRYGMRQYLQLDGTLDIVL